MRIKCGACEVSDMVINRFQFLSFLSKVEWNLIELTHYRQKAGKSFYS